MPILLFKVNLSIFVHPTPFYFLETLFFSISFFLSDQIFLIYVKYCFNTSILYLNSFLPFKYHLVTFDYFAFTLQPTGFCSYHAIAVVLCWVKNPLLNSKLQAQAQPKCLSSMKFSVIPLSELTFFGIVLVFFG